MKKNYTILALIFVITVSKAQWTAVNTGLTNLLPMTLVAKGSVVFTGTSGGGVFVSTNNGSNWTAVNTGLTDLYINALVISGTNIFAATQSGGVFLSINNGNNWASVNSGLPNLSVLSLGVSGSNIFAGTNGAGVFLSTNNGSSWTAVNAGFPTNPLPLISKFTVNGSNIFAGDGTMSGTCGVYLSTNNGTTWAAVNSGIFYMCVQALAISGTNIFTGNMGSVYLSSNNAGSWSAANAGLPASGYVSSFAVNNTGIFAGQSSGGVYLSSNNGTSWSDISTGLPAGKYVSSLALNGTNIFAGVTGMSGTGVFTCPLSALPVGIQETNNETFITIAPNPFNSETTISFSEELTNTILKITDISGKEIKSISLTGKSYVLEKGETGSGLFFIQLNQNNKTIHKKLVIE